MTRAELIALVTSNIYANNNNEVTAPMVRDSILAVIAFMGDAATYNVGAVEQGGTTLVTGGSVYSAINTALSAAVKFQGVTTTALYDGATTNPITIDGASYTARKGDEVINGGKEFLWTGTKWQQLGDEESWALKTVTISAGTGLTGGGDLTANRTISLSQDSLDKLALAASAYQLPATGIPKTDLAAAVQTTLGNADTVAGYFTSGILGSTHLPSMYVGRTQVAFSAANATLLGIDAISNAASSGNADKSRIVWDNTNKAWHFLGSIYADGFVSGGGLSTGGGTGGIDLDAMWTSLTTTSDAHGTDKIAAGHIPDMSSTYGYLKSADLSAYATRTWVGQNYLPLTGGTLWNNTRNFLKLSTTDANGPYIEFQINNNIKGYVGYYEAAGVATTWLGASSNRLFLDTTAASLRVGTDSTNYTVYHAGNFVAGTNYVSITGAETITGEKTFTSRVKIKGEYLAIQDSGGYNLGLYGADSNNQPQFYRPMAGDASWHTIYHSGNSNKSDVAWACSTLTASTSVSAPNHYVKSDAYPGMLFSDSTQDRWIFSKRSTQNHLHIIRYTSSQTYDTVMAFDYTNGNVGIGTNSPGEKLDVEGFVRVIEPTSKRFFSRMSTVTVGFYNDSTKYTGVWNCRIACGKDMTDSGVIAGAYMSNGTVLHYWYGGAAESSAAMYIKSDGRVAIGTSSAQTGYQLTVSGAMCLSGTGVGDMLRITTTASYCAINYYPTTSHLWTAGANNSGQFYFWNSGANGTVAYITSAGNFVAIGAVTGGAASDLRLKTNVASMTDNQAMSMIMALRPVTFTWNQKATELYDQYKGDDLGFIAQEVEGIPGLSKAIGTIFEDYKRLDPVKFIAPMVKVAQNHETRIQQLERELAQVKSENKQLRNRLNMS